jgi:hypothetical protein
LRNAPHIPPRRQARYDAGKKAKATGSNQHQERSRLSTDPRTLAELGVTKDQAADWAKLAVLSDEQFEAALAGPGKPTTSSIITATFPR